MLKTLQRNDGSNGETVDAVRPNELIIDSGYCDAVIEFIDSAKSEIRICAYAWRWYENHPASKIQLLNAALLRARQRGVKVRVLAETQIIRDKLRAFGIDVRGVEKNRMMHTKAFCFDYKTLILGSHNLTKRATEQNYEMSIISQEFQVVDAFVRYFDTVWSVRGQA